MLYNDNNGFFIHDNNGFTATTSIKIIYDNNLLNDR